MKAGDTFLIPDFDDHLWAVISDPSIDSQNVVIVLFVSWTKRYDQACVLRKGQHPFIKHDTCVQYPGAQVVTDSKLEEQLQTGKLRPKSPLSQELLEQIRRSAEQSDIPSRAYGILRDQNFVA